MRAVEREIFAAVLVVTVAALALPLLGLRAADVGAAASSRTSTENKAAAANVSKATVPARQNEVAEEARADNSPPGKISPDTLKALGIARVANPSEVSAKIGQALRSRLNNSRRGDVSVQSGQPLVLDARSALSDALIVAIGGRDNQFSEVALIADWDGREDCAADREQKVDDFSFAESEPDVELTRTAISEHTVANGFNQNVYYYGDSVGNLWVGTDLNPGVNLGSSRAVDGNVLQVNIPALLNTGSSGGFSFATPGGSNCTDDQVTVSGIAVNPVADLCDFGLGGTIGEVVYVSIVDTEGCGFAANNQPIRTRILEFAFTDGVGVAPAGMRQIFTSTLVDLAGVTVDDDGSLYFQLVDAIQFTGGAIFKLTELQRVTCGGTSCISRVMPPVTNTVTGINAWQGTTPFPTFTAGGVQGTNYSGPSTLWGDIVALTAGPCNVIYAAVSRSFVATDDTATQITEGLFPAPSAYGAVGTPSMVISFADCAGAFDTCTSPSTGIRGTLPVADGFADVAANGLSLSPGVNNFRIFVLGNGPDIRPASSASSVVPNTPATLLKVDMQIDYVPAHAGITVSGEGAVFVISGGAPAGVGKSPSPMLGEVLCFEDICPSDRRADFVDLRTTGDLPNPPASGGNVGDGVSDRFDHIFYQSPLDANTLTPAGLAGLARGFLRYTNRLAPAPIGPGVTLGVTGAQTVLGDDATSGQIIFENLDPGHQVAGGDDQNFPFTGDDNDGVGNPVLNGLRSGGFEFAFGGLVGANPAPPTCVWNGFFWNSNGNITFGAGDISAVASVLPFRAGLPKISPAWADLNPSSRAANCGTFPVMALGFENVNAFKIRWINVPEKGREACVAAGGGRTNTFSITLYDDGTGVDENNSQPLNPANPAGNNSAAFDQLEGPTDLRFTREPNTGQLVGCFPRPDGSGIFVFEYCRMDLLGTTASPVLVGYSIGGEDPLNPPGMCGINLSRSAAAADSAPFAALPDANNETTNICNNCCIGEGTEPTLFELFNSGSNASIGSGGEVTFAKPDFDLRFEGNDAALCTTPRQKDLNRGKVCFFGIGCAPPVDPQCHTVVPGTFVTPPTQSGIINAICQVQLNLVGCGFFPNETTTICQGFADETGVPLARPGKTVTSALTLTCDTNGDGVPEAVIVLTNVTPVNCNLLRGTVSPLSNLPGTGFAPACCGGIATLTATTTFTAGDNNAFGTFTRTTVCTVNLGTRAPLVFSVTPSGGDCSLADQDVLITGDCFQFVQSVPASGTTIVGNITSVFAVDAANANNVIQAKTFQVLNANVIDANFSFGTANAGHTFLIFVTGPGGTSRNLTRPVTGQPGSPCPASGNEQGVQVIFTCTGGVTACPTGIALPGCPCPPGVPVGTNGCIATPVDVALVNGCDLSRDENGNFILDVFGKNMKPGADVQVGSTTPKKIKFREPDPAFPGGFLRITLKGRICNGLPGVIVVTNPPPLPGVPAVPSQPFACTETCSSP